MAAEKIAVTRETFDNVILPVCLGSAGQRVYRLFRRHRRHGAGPLSSGAGRGAKNSGRNPVASEQRLYQRASAAPCQQAHRRHLRRSRFLRQLRRGSERGRLQAGALLRLPPSQPVQKQNHRLPQRVSRPHALYRFRRRPAEIFRRLRAETGGYRARSL